VLTAVTDGADLEEESPLGSARAAYVEYLLESQPDIGCLSFTVTIRPAATGFTTKH
jgi:hypothetical protein